MGDPVALAVSPRIGIVGAGSTRQGLGPYFALAFRAAGCRIAGVSGRDAASGERAAAELTARLGDPVPAHADATSLARAVDALVVAAPVAAHLAGLDAALAAGIPCLCEKPVVAVAELAAGRARIAAFRARGLLLLEHCQWPEVLPALWALHPELRGGRLEHIAMGLGPITPGRPMVVDSLSHVLSVVQALVPLPADAVPMQVRQADASELATTNRVTFTLPCQGGAVAVELHLQHTPAQPRPAWIAVNGLRIDRRIGANYAQSFVAADGRTIPVHDPMHTLVYGFVNSLRVPNRERTTTTADAIDLRLRLYAAILDALG